MPIPLRRLGRYGAVSLSFFLAFYGSGAGTSLAFGTPVAGAALPHVPSQSLSNHPGGAIASALALRKSWISRSAKTTPLLYVSDGENNLILIYPAKGHNPEPIGQLTGFDIAAGLAVDQAENLYVADVVAETVQVFHRGSTSPFEVLNVPGYPYGEAVDNSGNVYVAVAQTGSVQGFVAIYPAGATSPSSTLSDPSRGFSPVNVALDSQNDVFVSYDEAINTAPGGIDEFKAGTTTPINLGIKAPKGIGWLTIDQNGNLVVPNNGVRVYPPESKQPSLVFSSGKKYSPTQVAFDRSDDLIYVGENGTNPRVLNSVRVYSYPGAKLVNTISNGLAEGNPMDAVIGTAVDPGSPL
jgi:hypothetical protein